MIPSYIVINSDNLTAVSTFQALISQTNGSTMCSPLYIQNVLGLLYSGAGGATAATLQSNSFFGGATQASVATEFQQLITPLGYSDTGVQAITALFVEAGDSIRQSFQTTAANQFNAQVVDINFSASNPSSAINSYVAGLTNSGMLSVVPPGAFSASTNMLAFNGVGFNGAWIHEFNPANTQNGSFYPYCSRSAPITVPMMKQTVNVIWLLEKNCVTD